jgi:2',3'-cyclic-nucleotide 2'-phosphodiesterase (5'-nucleotidase family)
MTVAPLPIVCTNVERLVGEEWVPLGERYRIVEVTGVRVGILGVIDEHQFTDLVMKKTGNRVRRLPALEAIREVAALLQLKTDLIVLLAHVPSKHMEIYAASIPEVDVVLGGHVTRKDEGPVLIGRDGIVNRSGSRGMHVSMTRVIISPQGEVADFGGMNITLTKDFPEDPLVAEAAQSAKDRSASDRKARIEKTRERNAAQAPKSKRPVPGSED